MTLELAIVIMIACMVALGLIVVVVFEIIKQLSKVSKTAEIDALREDNNYQNVVGLIKSESKELKEAIISLKGTDRDDTEHERQRELCKKIQNDLYQMSAKYNVRNQQDYYIVMGIYLAIESITVNYANNADDNADYQMSKKFLRVPVDVDRIFKSRKGDS